MIREGIEQVVAIDANGLTGAGRHCRSAPDLPVQGRHFTNTLTGAELGHRRISVIHSDLSADDDGQRVADVTFFEEHVTGFEREGLAQARQRQ